MKTMKSWVAAAALLALTGAAQAGLVSNLDGTVTDTSTNLIWLKNWNVNGLAGWAAQKNWAENTLDGFAGSNDWRLPEIGEYRDLFSAYGDLTLNTQPFANVQPFFYWSGTAYTPTASAWIFHPHFGSEGVPPSANDLYYAVAVRSANVAAGVPEPQTLALALLALGATVAVRRRRPD